MQEKRRLAAPVAARLVPRQLRALPAALYRAMRAEAQPPPMPHGRTRFLRGSGPVLLLAGVVWLAGVSLVPALVHEMSWVQALHSKTLADHALVLLVTWLAAAAGVALWTHCPAPSPQGGLGWGTPVKAALASYIASLARTLALQAPGLLLALTALLLAPDPPRILKRLALGGALAVATAAVTTITVALPILVQGRRALLSATAMALVAATVAASYSMWRGDPTEWKRQTEIVLSDGRLDPGLAAKAAAIVKEVNAASDGTWWLGAYEGWRSAERQAQLLAQGHTTVEHSRHQDGCAVDLVFWVYGRGWSWEPDLPWHLVGEAATAHGLQAGYYWRTFKDPPHVELPKAPAGLEGGG